MGSVLQHLVRPLNLWHTENMKSISVSQKKRGRPATGLTPRVGVRLPDDIRIALDAYAAANSTNEANVSEAIRELLTEALREKGYLPAADDKAPDKA